MLDGNVRSSYRLGHRRLSSLLVAATCFFFILWVYRGIPKSHRDAALAAIADKASRPRPVSTPTPARQQSPSTETATPSASPPPAPTKLHASPLEAASNRTLGLDSVVFLNLAHRHDRFDAMAIQAHLSGIQVTRFPAVDATQVQNDLGMPPTENPGKLKDAEKACWRAHANVWQHMLEAQVPAVMVLESDAAWDVHLRPIMGRLNGGFRKLLKQEHPDVKFEEDPDDPWLARSGVWDVLSVGHCWDKAGGGGFVVYNDPHAPSSDYKWALADAPLNRQRVVYRAKSMLCTTGYLVSLSGAARLLVRTSWNLDRPVDIIMGAMTEAGELRTYSVQQKIVAQWQYIPGVGKTGNNSDIKAGNETSVNGTNEGWERARADRSSVEVRKEGYSDAHLVDFALGRAWQHIFGNV